MIDASLMTVDPANPSLIALYGLATLCRNLDLNDAATWEAWLAWSGATRYVFFPATSALQSEAVLVTDETNVILAYYGTRNIPQLIGQIAGSSGTSLGGVAGNVSTFDNWIAVQRNSEIVGALESFPTGTPICIVGHSLGGAIALETERQIRTTGNYSLTSLVTFGQPRVGNQAYVNAITTPYTRVVNDLDPVPNIPPNNTAFAVMVELNTFSMIGGSYTHKVPAWAISPPDLLPIPADESSLSSPASIAAALGVGSLFTSELISAHYLSAYCNQLRILLGA